MKLVISSIILVLFASAEELENYSDFDEEDEAEDDANLRRRLQTISYPLKLDYRNLGYMTSVKDQGSCGSCWVFSAMAGIEPHFKREGRSLDLAEQIGNECITDKNCSTGGVSAYIYKYFVSNGLPKESEFPYLTYNNPNICSPGSWSTKQLFSTNTSGITRRSYTWRT